MPSQAVTGDLADVLHTAGPHPSLADVSRLFDRFVGTWDTEYTKLDQDGQVRQRFAGEVVFGWIADGQAMQDVWISYADPEQGRERSIGTSIRFFDTSTGQWRVVFILPQANMLMTVQGGAVGNRIVLEGEDPDGVHERWSFNDIGPDSVTWRSEQLTDEGARWVLTDEYHMTRRRYRS